MGLIARLSVRRWSSNLPKVDKVWNENYFQRVADIENAQPKPAALSARVRLFARYYWDHTKHGLRDAWSDTKSYAAQSFGAELSAPDKMRRALTARELLKFLPFSFFVLVPFTELLLPFYLWLLPQMTPRYFNTPSARAGSEARERAAQEAAHAVLRAHLLRHLKLERAGDGQALAAAERRLVEDWPSHRAALGPAAFDLELAQAALDFLRAPHISGKHIVSELLNLHVLLLNALYRVGATPHRLEKTEYAFAFWPLAELRTALLRWQFERHVAALRRTDAQFAASPRGSLAQLDFLEAARFMAERGISAPTRESAERQYEQLWLAQPAGDAYLLLWLQVLRRDRAAEAVKA